MVSLVQKFSDIVSWPFELACPCCGELFEGEASVFPKDSGVSLNCPEFEDHIDRCKKFNDEYRELMGYA